MKGPFKNFQLGIDHISGVRTRGEKKNERNEKEGAEIEWRKCQNTERCGKVASERWKWCRFHWCTSTVPEMSGEIRKRCEIETLWRWRQGSATVSLKAQPSHEKEEFPIDMIRCNRLSGSAPVAFLGRITAFAAYHSRSSETLSNKWNSSTTSLLLNWILWFDASIEHLNFISSIRLIGWLVANTIISHGSSFLSTSLELAALSDLLINPRRNSFRRWLDGFIFILTISTTFLSAIALQGDFGMQVAGWHEKTQLK